MHFMNLTANYLDRKYRVPMNIFFQNLTRLCKPYDFF